MATPFSDVYDSFLSNITSYKLADLIQNNSLEFEANAESWLKNAISLHPNPSFDVNLIDWSGKSFIDTLSINEISILSKYMALSFLSTIILKEDLYQQYIGSKDINFFSQANQLKALIDVKNNLNSEINTIISRNSYNIKKIKDTRKKLEKSRSDLPW